MWPWAILYNLAGRGLETHAVNKATLNRLTMITVTTMEPLRHSQQLLIGRLSNQTVNFLDNLSNIEQIRKSIYFNICTVYSLLFVTQPTKAEL